MRRWSHRIASRYRPARIVSWLEPLFAFVCKLQRARQGEILRSTNSLWGQRAPGRSSRFRSWVPSRNRASCSTGERAFKHASKPWVPSLLGLVFTPAGPTAVGLRFVDTGSGALAWGLSASACACAGAGAEAEAEIATVVAGLASGPESQAAGTGGSSHSTAGRRAVPRSVAGPASVCGMVAARLTRAISGRWAAGLSASAAGGEGFSRGTFQ